MKSCSIQKRSPQQLSGCGEEVVLLDVRTPAEFGEVHIAGSVLHPLSDLDADAVKNLMGLRSSCVVICRSGNRARQAAERLSDAGLDNLEILDGGVLAWEKAGLPVNRGKNVMSLERQVRIAAGTLVVVGVLLSYFVHSAFIALPGFVGAGLIFAGITDTCGMGMMLAKMPWNTRRGSKAVSCCTT